MGIRDEHPDARSATERIQAALNAPVFLAQQTPRPASLSGPIKFPESASVGPIRIFLRKQLNRIYSFFAANAVAFQTDG